MPDEHITRHSGGGLLDRLKAITPAFVKRMVARVLALVHYRDYDSSVYWRQRAGEEGQAAVLWKNEEYNELYRQLQRETIERFVSETAAAFGPEFRVLDIGCGTGIVAAMLVGASEACQIDAVDFPEMIEVARQNNPSARIHYIPSSAEDFSDPALRYELIVSSGCYAAIRNIDTMKKAIRNGADMLSPNGTMLLIDPFHRWKYLARARFSSKQVTEYMASLGCDLTYRSGVLFWPYRDWLANSPKSGPELEKRFHQGERLLARLGRHLWADYKILAFTKRADGGT